VLISGKTGSGKSTLLHVLILNVAMRYSPDEIQLYLVDFKKGVEFKAYADAALPHARVVAIESEREFGLSVLERLDQELKERGDQFRRCGVQDLSAFRGAAPGEKMPRILLIVDEFQELFVEDDRLAQSAALLLDRLVRQGRAFGIHVLLGSQTLAGAYSIPRATLGQMAVRIALQCSEADAHLILSEENAAARLLGRPGEAIYNDANGLYEGNHPFQVVWLSDSEREQYLHQIRRFANARNFAGPPAIVFEGNVPADAAANPALARLLDEPAWPARPRAATAYLGSAVAIREPMAAVFARQAGANLLVAGHQEEMAFGVLGTAVVSLAAQYPPAGSDGRAAQFYVLDGTRPDAPQAGLWGRLAAALPHAIRIDAPRQARSTLAEIHAEFQRREQSGGDDDPPIYLVIYDLGRFRDLRKADDDFGFSRSSSGDEPPSPARILRDLLHDGPAQGIHLLVWGDSYNNITRALDRPMLEDMEIRVLFRMNAADSSNLIDSAAASQLGVYRAVYADEGLGVLEKFRPYGLPRADWLATLKDRLSRRAADGKQ
jgi:energy-coupling factor transporter ATP-binding protein EcfA2